MMKKYPKYKTIKLQWFGEIPNHWNLTSLKNLLEKVYGGGTPNTAMQEFWAEDDEPDSIPWVAISDITKSNGTLKNTSKRITEAGRKDKGLEILPKGTLLMSIFASLGKTTILDIDATINQAILGLVPSKKLNLDFLEYLLVDAERYVSYFSSASTQENLNLTKIRNLQFPIPPNEEQTKIAQYLDHQTTIIDLLIQQKEKLIELLKENRQAVINETVTKGLNPNAKMKDSGIEWLGEVPNQWVVVKLKHVIEMKSGNFISAEMIEDEGLYPIYGGNGIRGYHSEYSHEGFYPLIGRQGALCGNINYANGKFWPTEHAVVVSPKKQVDIYWMGELLRIMNLNQYSQASAQPGLSVEKILNLRIPLPSYEEQKEIALKLKALNEKFEFANIELGESISKLKVYRQSIISEAITGKVDVSDWQPNKS